jgi:hypothetical protein
MKLNLGCGQHKLPGYVNVDKYAACAPDRVVDLEVTPWPFADGAADEIVMNHVLEHLGQQTQTFLAIMQELYRVMKPGARLHLGVPHPRSESFLGDPTHVRPISPAVLSLFSRRGNQECKEKGWANTPLAFYLGVDFEIEQTVHVLTPRWKRKVDSGAVTMEELKEAIETHHNVVDEYRMVVRKVAA